MRTQMRTKKKHTKAQLRKSCGICIEYRPDSFGNRHYYLVGEGIDRYYQQFLIQ